MMTRFSTLLVASSLALLPAAAFAQQDATPKTAPTGIMEHAPADAGKTPAIATHPGTEMTGSALRGAETKAAGTPATPTKAETATMGKARSGETTTATMKKGEMKSDAMKGRTHATRTHSHTTKVSKSRRVRHPAPAKAAEPVKS